MNMLGRVRRLHSRDGLTISEIERRTGLARKTIRKRLKAPEGVEPKYRRQAGDTKITPFAARLTKLLKTDARRPVREGCTALKLQGILKAEGFAGDYSRVTEFIRGWRADGGRTAVKAYVPLQFEPAGHLARTGPGGARGTSASAWARSSRRPPTAICETGTARWKWRWRRRGNEIWPARRDSNARPLPSEGSTLSS